uniref:Putative Metal dependent phosphohydrolase n=1 Tax=Magnetococcus massalia (strain MO-1) TaxID=451514 RepID=A0A1S7LF07_MAGMO|nr:putative Metal dependent phosphohydrolase [Candidatus Magnetococcus massalia]
MAEEQNKLVLVEPVSDDRLAHSMRLRPDQESKGAPQRLLNKLRESWVWGWGGFLLLITLLTLIYSPLAFRAPHLPEVGEVATRNVKAERDILVEDARATKERRKLAVQEVPAVYDWDAGMATSLIGILEDRLGELNQGIQSALKGDKLPDLELQVPLWAEQYGLSQPVVRNLLHVSGLPEALDQARVQQAVRMEMEDELEGEAQDPVISPLHGFTRKDKLNPGLEHLVARLHSWMKSLSHLWVVADTHTQKKVQRKTIAVHALDSSQSFRLTIPERVVILKQFQTLVRHSADRHLTGLERPLRNWILSQVQEYVRPNLTFNGSQTRLHKREAGERVDQVFLRVRRGQMVVREGEVVTEGSHLKLEALNKGAMSDFSTYRILGLAVTIGLFLYIGRLFLLRTATAFPRDRLTLEILGTLLVVSASLSAFTYAVGQGMAGLLHWPEQSALYLPPVAIGSALASLIIGARVSLPGGTMVLGVVLSFLTSQLAGGGLPLFIYFMVGSLVGGLSLRTCRKRFDVLRSGMWVGLTQMMVVPAVELLAGHAPGLQWGLYMSMGLASGILTGLFALALIPLIESLFDVTTDSRLMELAAGDHPLLKELSLRSPGTYHHSVMMGNLAEAAAERIGANPLLARVMALYHDIGKMAKPQYFVENQSGANRHDQLSPSMSAKIIMSHIKSGIVMAREYKLGEPIEEAIRTHQGTSLLQFFYNKALNEAAKRGESVSEEDYRYPGPIPQTREAGILMLADSVEAATRSLKDPSPAQIQNMVRRIINNKIRDGQLDDCKLTVRELAVIEEAFLRVLTLGFYHRRIAYPEIRKPREAVSHVPSLGAIAASGVARSH